MAADDPPFNDPSLAINRVYTKHGDGGSTRLVGGQRVAKHDTRIEAYGTVDELNAFVGACCLSAGERPEVASLQAVLLRVQHELFNLGSILATLPEDVHPKQPRITEADVEALEHDIDARQADLAPLRSFVLPGGCRLNVELHVARTICRRAERRCVELEEKAPGSSDPLAVKYLNRLSDALFVWSRWASHRLGVPETLWDPNLAAAATATRR